MLAGSYSFLELVQVGKRITKSIDVIDSQPGKGSLCNQAQDIAVSRLEHVRIFDADSHQFCNGEKAAIVNALIQILPERQLVVLLSEKALQECETRRIALLAVDLVHVFFKKGHDLATAFHQGPQTV